jgi:Zn-dependent M28 family amino/carboxypeptidase
MSPAKPLVFPGVTLSVLLLAACGEPVAPVNEETATVAQTAASADASASMFSNGELAAADSISAERMRSVIAEIADDRYQGRAPGSVGDALTRRFLIQQMADLGLQPGGENGTWEQVFDLLGITSLQPPVWTFNSAAGELQLKQSDDFIAASGVQAELAQFADAEVVFVGYGIQAPEYQWDDFKGMDLRGKVLLMLNNDPDWDPALFAGFTRLYYGRWDYKFASAARQGAAAAIILHTAPSAGYLWQVVQTSFSGQQFELPAADEPRTQVNAWVTEDAARRLVAQAGLELDALLEQAKQREFQPVPLGVTTSLALNNTLVRTTSANVIGVLPGSDPGLAEQALIYTAHHDHLGMAEPTGAQDEDLIYNGALDNATGVAQVLAVARAFTALPQAPRRSIVLNFVGAEEQGLLGSEYYSLHPTYAPGKIAANINLDGGSIWGRTRDLTFIGYGKSSLDAPVVAVASRYGRTVTPDQFPDRGYFYRSDQFNFARIGVPAVYLDGGTDVIGQPAGWGEEQINRYTDENYHQPSDELDDSWNFEGMVEDAAISFLLGLSIANDEDLPSWNPGDEFEAARLAALQAAR